MATLGKIRSKGILLLVVVGLALLAFIVGDFINNSTSLFHESKNYVGKINGQKVKAQEFQNRINQLTEVYQMEYGTTALPEQANEEIRQSTWDNLVTERVLTAEIKQIGMTVSHNELEELVLGDNISPLISNRRMFVNPETGNFDRALLANFISQIDNDELAAQMGNDKLEQLRNYWKYWENAVRIYRLQEKYNMLLTKAIVVNSQEAKSAFDASQNTVSVVYAIKPYFSIPDSTIAVKDQDIKARYEQKREQYKQEASCDLQYVTFALVPSQEDFKAVETEMLMHKNELATTNDVEEVVNFESDVPYINANMTREEVPEELREFAFGGSQDSVFGPLLCADNTYMMARIMSHTTAPDSIKVRHIVLQEDTEEATKHLADSLMNALAEGADFATLAHQYSRVKQTANMGGEIGWIHELGMDHEIAKQAFTSAINTPFKIAKEGIATIQIMEVTERSAACPKVNLAIISHKVVPTASTQNAIYQEAKRFAGESVNAESFAQKAEEYKYTPIMATRLDINATHMNDLKDARQIIKWAYENKVGATSDVFECGNQLVVALITRRNEKGYQTLEEVRPTLEAELRREAKGETLKAELQNKTIEQLIAIGCNSDTVKGVNFASPYNGSLGNEPTLSALAPLAEPNQLSQPIAGSMGVYVFKVIEKMPNTAEYNEKEEKAMLNARNQYAIPYMALEALKTAAKVSDERYRFF